MGLSSLLVLEGLEGCMFQCVCGSKDDGRVVERWSEYKSNEHHDIYQSCVAKDLFLYI